ncbi:RNA-directed DNA polymerase, eukaryota [Tanacetum coccineum]
MTNLKTPPRQDKTWKGWAFEVACSSEKTKTGSARSLRLRILSHQRTEKSFVSSSKQLNYQMGSDPTSSTNEFPNKDMKEEFLGWFGKQIRQRHVDNDLGVSKSSELFALACGPSQTPILVNSCVVNDEEMYYGQLEQILEFSYLSFKTVLFRVKWFDTSNKGRIQNFVIRNNITQIKANGEAFKNDQYILATQVKQCFYLEDMARRPLGWKVVEHVSHKKFSNRGVIVVEEDPDVIHVDNSSDLALSTSLNDLEIAALHIDGQSIDVDAPPDIIDVVDEDDDIIDEEDPIPHDLADSDDEDLVNLDIDDGVNVVYSSEEED